MLAIPQVLTAAEIAEIRAFLAQATFADGKLTAGEAIRARKNNLQLDRGEAGGAVPADAIVAQGIFRHPLLQAWAQPLQMTAPLFNRYGVGMHYGNHVDAPVVGNNPKIRADLSLTLFLSEPSEYDGGELVVESPAGPLKVKLPAGHAFIYLSNALHRVENVTRGERFAAVTWIQSVVRDDRMRAILFDLTAVNQALTVKMPNSPELELLNKAQHNLQRLCSDL